MFLRIGEKKKYGGATPTYVWLKDYYQDSSVTGGIKAWFRARRVDLRLKLKKAL